MTVFVGIDPSITNTGVVCLGHDGKLLGTLDGRIHLKSRRGRHGIQDYVDQAEGIRNFLADYNVAAIGYEDYSYDSPHNAYALAEYGGVLKSTLMGVTKNIVLIAPTKNKKFAIHGQATKEMMAKAALAECPEFSSIKPTYDVCDAYFLAKYVWYFNNMETAARVDRGNANLRTRLTMVHDHRR